jgi:hypothetical protein
MAIQKAVCHGRLYVRLWILCTICARVVRSYTFLRRLHTVGNECPLAQCFCTQKLITERNSHLAGEASGSSNSNGCQAKTERRTHLVGVGTGRGGTKLHASVAGSRVIAFLATAAPLEPYFTDSPRRCLHFLKYRRQCSSEPNNR